MADKNVNIHLKTTADVKGAQAAKKAVDDFAKAEKSLRQVIDDVNDLSDDQRASLHKLADQLENVKGRANNLATAQVGGAKSTRNSSMALLELSRAAEDAQYGIRGVLNNIPGLIISLGGTAGLAGAISIAAVALAQLLPRMREWMGMTDDAKEAQEALKASVERFKDAINRQRTDAIEAAARSAVDAQGREQDAYAATLNSINLQIRALAQLDRAATAAIDKQGALDKLRIDAALQRGEIDEPTAIAAKAQVDRDVRGRRLSRERATSRARIQLGQYEAGVAQDKARETSRRAGLAAEDVTGVRSRLATFDLLATQIADLDAAIKKAKEAGVAKSPGQALAGIDVGAREAAPLVRQRQALLDQRAGLFGSEQDRKDAERQAKALEATYNKLVSLAQQDAAEAAAKKQTLEDTIYLETQRFSLLEKSLPLEKSLADEAERLSLAKAAEAEAARRAQAAAKEAAEAARLQADRDRAAQSLQGAATSAGSEALSLGRGLGNPRFEALLDRSIAQLQTGGATAGEAADLARLLDQLLTYMERSGQSQTGQAIRLRDLAGRLARLEQQLANQRD